MAKANYYGLSSFEYYDQWKQLSKAPKGNSQMAKFTQSNYTWTTTTTTSSMSGLGAMPVLNEPVSAPPLIENIPTKGKYGCNAKGQKLYMDGAGELYVQTSSGWKSVVKDYLESSDKGAPKKNDTQKVRGIRLLSDLRDEIVYVGDQFNPLHQAFRVFALDTDGKQVSEGVRLSLPAWRENGYDLFARPCPPKAVHGYIESRKIPLFNRHLNTVYGELRELYDTILKHDKDGQLLLMPYVKAAYNIVLANGMVTIGAYHDGATANRKAITLPTGDIKLSSSLLKAAGIEDQPYIELVAGKEVNSHFARPTFVQLRNGPKIPRCKDFLPFTTTVKSIYTVTKDADMLEFAEIVKRLNEKGNVVYCADGGINSHPGVHCALNGIPFITSRLPKVGERWEKNSAKKKECDRTAFTSGIAIAARVRLSIPELPGSISYRSAIESMLFILHSLPFADLGDAMQARMFGFACGIAVRLGMTACIGEARYGYPNTAKRCVSKGPHKVSREAAYTAATTTNLDEMIGRFVEVVPAFGWRGWSSISDNVGGTKWHVCGLQVAKLWNTIVDYCNDKGGVTAVHCADALNNVVNVSHNSNRLLTKFANSNVFAAASEKGLPYISLRNVSTLYRLAVDRVPQLATKLPSLVPIDIEAIGPNINDIIAIIEGYGEIYRPDRVLFFKEIYKGFPLDFAKMEALFAEAREKRLVEIREANKSRNELYEQFREKYIVKIPWQLTEGCSNCHTSPFLGSYCSWNVENSCIELQPCAGCNYVSYGKSFEAVTITDEKIEALFEVRFPKKEPQKKKAGKSGCVAVCKNCGLCQSNQSNGCQCDVELCGCTQHCSNCGEDFKVYDPHECEDSCKECCGDCGECPCDCEDK